MDDNIRLKHIHTMWVDGKYACFKGNTNKHGIANNDEYEVHIPLTEITDNMHYFIDKRIQFIERSEKFLLSEKQELKQKFNQIKKKVNEK
jgi:hypothetical protein